MLKQMEFGQRHTWATMERRDEPLGFTKGNYSVVVVMPYRDRGGSNHRCPRDWRDSVDLGAQGGMLIEQVLESRAVSGLQQWDQRACFGTQRCQVWQQAPLEPGRFQ